MTSDYSPSRDDFDVAVICALGTEAEAVDALFDSIWEDTREIGREASDKNIYTLGLIGGHHVVLAWMPEIGKTPAAVVAVQLRSSFTKIKLVLVVGICGGVPYKHGGAEILLGDVIISTVLKIDEGGKQYPSKYFTKDAMCKPDSEMRSLLTKLGASAGRKRLRELSFGYATDLLKMEDFIIARYPGADEDKLYKPTYIHKHHDGLSCNICTKDDTNTDMVCADAFELTCEELNCDKEMLVSRPRLEEIKKIVIGDPTQPPQSPLLHFGTVASGNTVMKSGQHRDQIAKKDKVIAFEMEGAGVFNLFPSVVVIKGVCDYADSHKNKLWQPYAAVTAAACMKAFLKLKEESSGMSFKEHTRQFINMLPIPHRHPEPTRQEPVPTINGMSPSEPRWQLHGNPITSHVPHAPTPQRAPTPNPTNGNGADVAQTPQHDRTSQGNLIPPGADPGAVSTMPPNELPKPIPAAPRAQNSNRPVLGSVPQRKPAPSLQTTASNTQNSLPTGPAVTDAISQPPEEAEPVPPTQSVIPKAIKALPVEAGSITSPEQEVIPVPSGHDVASSSPQVLPAKTEATPQPAEVASPPTFIQNLDHKTQHASPLQSTPELSTPAQSPLHQYASPTQSTPVQSPPQQQTPLHSSPVPLTKNFNPQNQPLAATGLGISQVEVYRAETDPKAFYKALDKALDYNASDTKAAALTSAPRSLSMATTVNGDNAGPENVASRRLIYSDKAPGVSVVETLSPETIQLLQACQDRKPDIVKQLLKKPHLIDISATDPQGQGVLHLVLGSGKVNSDRAKRLTILTILRLLCNHQADPNTTDRAGLTPIHHCAMTINTEAAIYLLDHGANIHAVDARDRTALYYAAAGSHPDFDFVKKLPGYGAKMGRAKLPPLLPPVTETQRKVRALVARIGST